MYSRLLYTIIFVSLFLFNSYTFAEESVKPNYIEYTSFSQKPIIWKKNNINVYILDSDSNKFRKMFFLWQEALKDKISFTFVNDKNSSDIVVSFADNDSSSRLGSEGFVFAQNNLFFRNDSIYKAKIYLFKKNPKTNEDFSEQDILFYLLHEIGHVLGIINHSPNENDVMFYAPRSNLLLSQRDINTINLLYSNTTNIDIQKTEEFRKKNIEFYNKEMPNEPLYIVEIGNYYRFNSNYKKAITYYKKAIKLDSTNIHYYYPMCISYYKLKKYKKAYNCFESLVEKEPNNLQYLHAFSIASKKTNKTDKVRENLDDFIKNNDYYDTNLIKEIKENIGYSL